MAASTSWDEDGGDGPVQDAEEDCAAAFRRFKLRVQCSSVLANQAGDSYAVFWL